MLGLRDFVVATALLGCYCVLCDPVLVNRTGMEANIRTIYGDVVEAPVQKELPVSLGSTKKEDSSDTVIKKFRFPLCGLPKKGTFICNAICVLLLNDQGYCDTGKICVCVIKESTETGTFFSFLGK